jgi:hypothetical protein
VVEVVEGHGDQVSSGVGADWGDGAGGFSVVAVQDDDVTSGYSFDSTSSTGMFALWQPENFRTIDRQDMSTWENELIEDLDIERHIGVGAFVPITLSFDGSFNFSFSFGELTARELRYAKLISDKYSLMSHGEVMLSGLEDISGEIYSSVTRLILEGGMYQVRVYLIAWYLESGYTQDGAESLPGVLPDFIVQIQKSDSDDQDSFRTSAETFDQDELVRVRQELSSQL